MQVVARRHAGRPNGADLLALLHGLADSHVDPRQVGVERGDAATVVDHHDAAVPRVARRRRAREKHRAGFGGDDRVARDAVDVDAGVMSAATEGTGDRAGRRPNRRRGWGRRRRRRRGGIHGRNRKECCRADRGLLRERALVPRARRHGPE